MPNKYTNKWEQTKLQIYEIILHAFPDLSKSFVSDFKQIEFLLHCIADMLRDLAYAIMSAYPSVQKKFYFIV